jgi:hypothetical protein
MNRISVSSSNLTSVGYDPATQTLKVEFLHDSTHLYLGVPLAIYDTWMADDFRDIYFDRYIKNAGYSYQKVR